jgi:tocopherol cyclase
MKRFDRVIHPELFQGLNRSKTYFEGWYFKHVSANSAHVLSIIPGISYEDNNKSAFIQIIIGPPYKSYYIPYPIEKFHWCDDPFRVQIDECEFTTSCITLDINTEDIEIQGNIEYPDISKLNSTILEPNIMGFFAYFKFMQCNHGIISLNHKIDGNIKYNGMLIDFSKGKGYIEKDWGVSFPKKYIWIQTNNFDDDSVSLFSSIASIPFLKLKFLGFIMVLKVGNEQYRFATYNGSKIIKVKYEKDSLYIEVKRKKFLLKIRSKYNKGHLLKAPKNGVMGDEIIETLEGVVEVSLKKNGENIYEGLGTNAGVEVVNWT